MQDYDGNVLARQQLPRADFNQAVIKAEDDPSFFCQENSLSRKNSRP